MEAFTETLFLVIEPLADPKKRVFWLYIVLSFLVGGCWLRIVEQKSLRSVAKDLFSRRCYFSRSAIVDYQIAIINQIILAFISPYLLTQLFVATLLFEGLHRLDFSPQFLHHALSGMSVAILFTAAFFILDDFARFFVHRLLHKVPLFWAFHKVHHSANSLNPLTVYRTHPVEAIIFSLRGVCVQGLLITIFVFSFGEKVDLLTVYTANLFAFFFNITGANLRHTHVRVRYWTWLESVLISPHQHQIHHSSLPEHRDKNFGVALAVWDTIAGSLQKSKSNTYLEFGLEAGKSSNDQQSILGLYFHPFIECWSLLKRRCMVLLSNRQDTKSLSA